MPAAGYDAFVTKFAPSGTQVVYSTLLGGVNSDIANHIAVDGSGAAYVTGWTISTNFPATVATNLIANYLTNNLRGIYTTNIFSDQDHQRPRNFRWHRLFRAVWRQPQRCRLRRGA